MLVDGQRVGALAGGERAVVRVGARPSLLATLPEATFFSRYAATFGALGRAPAPPASRTSC